MMRASRLLLLLFVWLLAAPPAARAASEPALFRIFFTDGTFVVSYGELSRVDDLVIFTMPVGGSAEQPRLHPVTLPASLVDWTRTDKYAASTRYQHYASRAAADYEQLTDEVAALLNEIATSTDRPRALALAQQARSTLLQWPRNHYGYRADDVREIVTLLDTAISRLAGAPANEFSVSLVAAAEPVEVEPLTEMPSSREQVEQVERILRVTTTGRDRIALLQAGLALLNEAGGAIDRETLTTLRRSFERQLGDETTLDQRYARLAQQVLAAATRAAGRARIADVERALDRIAVEDHKLGGRRPDIVQALTTSVRAQLERAQRLRLLRDQWVVRQSLYRQYDRSVGREVRQLVKAQPLLEAIRRLDGPDPERLTTLQLQLAGGAARLERLTTPEFLRSTHDLLVGAWRFAERAARARQDAITSGDLATAWSASSAAAGSLMMLSRAQQEIRALIDPPKLR